MGRFDFFLPSIRRSVRRLYTQVKKFPLFIRFLNERASFVGIGGIVSHLYPIITDYNAEAGTASGHYFHQDLLIASLIHQRNPWRHLDIGSRFDGFVAHVASYRKIEVLDVRDLNFTGHPNIEFLQADLMQSDEKRERIADSISCLHAIEHFGLGRYGDAIDPEGHLAGFINICKMLEPGGVLYISFPIGRQDQVHFNAHRVFHPLSIFDWPSGESKMELERFDFVDDFGDLHTDYPIFDEVPLTNFGCGIYTLRKLRSKVQGSGA